MTNELLSTRLPSGVRNTCGGNTTSWGRTQAFFLEGTYCQRSEPRTPPHHRSATHEALIEVAEDLGMPNAVKKEGLGTHSDALKAVSLWWSLMNSSAIAHFHFLTVHRLEQN